MRSGLDLDRVAAAAPPTGDRLDGVVEDLLLFGPPLAREVEVAEPAGAGRLHDVEPGHVSARAAPKPFVGGRHTLHRGLLVARDPNGAHRPRMRAGENRYAHATLPELPEVESVRRQLVPELAGRRIVDVWWDPHPAARISHLDRATGHAVSEVSRRGKFLLLALESTDGTEPLELVLHLGMSGSLRITPRGPDHVGAHDRVAFELDDGRVLRMRDPRRFGRASVVDVGRYAPDIPTLATLGPEPLTSNFSVEAFAAELARRRAPVKALLLSQTVVAGVGNIYADEALWRAGIHPAARSVGPRRARRLHGHLRDVLQAAVDREGTTFRDHQMVNGSSGRYAAFLDVYGRAGLPCPRCGTVLRRSTVGGRTSTWCPRCQR